MGSSWRSVQCRRYRRSPSFRRYFTTSASASGLTPCSHRAIRIPRVSLSKPWTHTLSDCGGHCGHGRSPIVASSTGQTYCSQDGGHFEHTCVWWRPRTCVSSRTTQAERGQSKSAQVTTATAPGDSSAVDARSSAADASADVGRFEDDIPWARCAALPSRRRERRQRKGGREGAGKWRGNKGPRFCGTALPAKTSLRCGEGRSARLVLLREGSEAEDSPLQFKASCDRK
jgi:hypothetical protein